MAIEKFTRENIGKFREDFNKAIENLEKEYGVKISLNNIRFTPESFHTKIEVKIEGSKPDYIRNWEAGYHRKFGIESDYLGATLNLKAKDGNYLVKIVGCDRTGKYPIRVEVLEYHGTKKIKIGEILGIKPESVHNRGANLAKRLGILD
jgi:hypothetical protein